MTGFTAPGVVSPNLIAGAPAAPGGKTPERIAATAKEFEAAYLQVMLSQMFSGVSAGEFGGGQGEEMFKSFLLEAFSKQMTRAGGVGVSDAVQREMLKLQGLED